MCLQKNKLMRVASGRNGTLMCMPRSRIAGSNGNSISTGKTQRDRVEREVGGGIVMGNTCKPMAVSFQCMTKSTTIKKKKKKKAKKKKKKINGTLKITATEAAFLTPLQERVLRENASF